MHDGGVLCGTFMKVNSYYDDLSDLTTVGLEGLYKNRLPFFTEHTDLHVPISL